MTVQEMKLKYKTTLREIQYLVGRMEHEQKKEDEIVAINEFCSGMNVSSSENDKVKVEELDKIRKSQEKMMKLKQEITMRYELQRKIEEQIDTIEDVDTKELVWRYCVVGQTQEKIGEILGLSQSLINKKLKKVCF